MKSSGKIEKKAKETIAKYRLFGKKEKIIVAASGGKDSTAALFILKKLGYNVNALSVDVGMGEYSSKNLENLKEFCRENSINLNVVSFRDEFGGSLCYLRKIFEQKGIKMSSCALCGVLRRSIINKYAKQMKADKIVTGHNTDDEAQSIMMNFFRNTLERSARLGPISGKRKAKGFVPRVKPLYFCSEKDIEAYSKENNFPVKYGICPCSAEVFRRFTGNMLDDYEKINPRAKKNIVDNFLKILPNLKKKYKGGSYVYCKRCGEPSREAICRACELVNVLSS